MVLSIIEVGTLYSYITSVRTWGSIDCMYFHFFGVHHYFLVVFLLQDPLIGTQMLYHFITKNVYFFPEKLNTIYVIIF